MQLIASQLYDVVRVSTARWASGVVAPARGRAVVALALAARAEAEFDIYGLSPMALASSMGRGATTSTPHTYVESISSVWSNVSFKRNTFAREVV